jgi:hypothetical protein
MNPTRSNGLRTVASIWIALLFSPLQAEAGGSVVPVGEYLYAAPEALEAYEGSLTVRFVQAGDKLVVAYGHRYRKERMPRTGTTEQERQRFKPVRAELRDDGRTAVFAHLAPDRYDLVVILNDRYTVYEGLTLAVEIADHDRISPREARRTVELTLARPEGRVAGWEAFFDHKTVCRIETDGVRAGVFVHQMRTGEAFAESGARLEGRVHSLDVCRLEATRARDGRWQVTSRQQLFRDELPLARAFETRFLQELRGIRVVRTPQTLGPLDLDALASAAATGDAGSN